MSFRFLPLLPPLVLLVVAALAGGLPCQRNDAAHAPFRLPVRLGTMPVKVVAEASGLVRSRRRAGVFWTHNDSGGAAELMAVRADGRLVRRVAVPGATNVDWEDLAIDDRGRLVIGDLGDNLAERDVHVLYRIAEPDPEGREPVGDVEVFRFRAPSGCARLDAEALWIVGDFAFVVTKENRTARLLRVPLAAPTTDGAMPVEAELLGSLDGLVRVTGAAVSDDGTHVALLTYQGVVVFDLDQPLPAERPAAEVLLALQRAPRREQAMLLGQCEGITFDGGDLVVATERGPLRWGEPLLWRLVPK